MSNFVLGFVVDPESKMVALLRKRKPDKWAGLFNGIAGTVKEGETNIAAMVRKCEEECGVITTETEWVPRCEMSTPDGPVHVFIRIGNVFALHQCEDEPVLYLSLLSNWTREPVVPSLKWLLPLVLDFSIKNIPGVVCE